MSNQELKPGDKVKIINLFGLSRLNWIGHITTIDEVIWNPALGKLIKIKEFKNDSTGVSPVINLDRVEKVSLTPEHLFEIE